MELSRSRLSNKCKFCKKRVNGFIRSRESEYGKGRKKERTKNWNCANMTRIWSFCCKYTHTICQTHSQMLYSNFDNYKWCDFSAHCQNLQILSLRRIDLFLLKWKKKWISLTFWFCQFRSKMANQVLWYLNDIVAGRLIILLDLFLLKLNWIEIKYVFSHIKMSCVCACHTTPKFCIQNSK